MKVSTKVGNQRLRELAKILKAAHARYRRKNVLNAGYMSEKGYFRGSYAHACGTPSCAMGHWAYAHPDRWNICGTRKGGTGWGPEDQAQEFALSAIERDELFSGTGCGGAETALEAANFILAFVERREKRANGARGVSSGRSGQALT